MCCFTVDAVVIFRVIDKCCTEQIGRDNVHFNNLFILVTRFIEHLRRDNVLQTGNDILCAICIMMKVQRSTIVGLKIAKSLICGQNFQMTE